MPPRAQTLGQESLLAFSQQTGMSAVRDFGVETAAANDRSLIDGTGVISFELDPTVVRPDQAVHVVEALRRFGRMSSATGLDKASSGRARRSLESRHDNVDALVGKVPDVMRSHRAKAREAYEKACGRTAIIASGQDPELVDAEISRGFELFLQFFADPKNAGRRKNVSNELKRVIRRANNKGVNSSSTSSPRGKRRDDSPPTAERVIIDFDRVNKVDHFLNKVYKGPVLDEMTMGYAFKPNVWGVDRYTSPGSSVINTVEDPNNRERQSADIALSAQKATALFYAVAILRQRVLSAAIRDIAHTDGDNPQVQSHLAAYAADAIAELGQCMRVSSNIPNNRFEGVDRHIEQFGLRAALDPKKLATADGVLLMQLAFSEQDRRVNFWRPRFDALVAKFGNLLDPNFLDVQRVDAFDVKDLKQVGVVQ